MTNYVTGFVISLLLTLAAYFLAVHHVLPHQALLVTIVALACIQFFVQMMCFLHLNGQADSRDRLTVLIGAAVVVFILVSGSLWIMDSLNARMMPSTQEMEQYMQGQQGI